MDPLIKSLTVPDCFSFPAVGWRCLTHCAEGFFVVPHCCALPLMGIHRDDPVMTETSAMADARVTRLSKRTVDLARPEPKRFTMWDTELKGFGVVVQPSGVKSYIVRYRIGGGRSGTLKQMVLGRHGALTPDEARTLGRKALAAVAHGNDPAGVRAQARVRSRSLTSPRRSCASTPKPSVRARL